MPDSFGFLLVDGMFELKFCRWHENSIDEDLEDWSSGGRCGIGVVEGDCAFHLYAEHSDFIVALSCGRASRGRPTGGNLKPWSRRRALPSRCTRLTHINPSNLPTYHIQAQLPASGPAPSFSHAPLQRNKCDTAPICARSPVEGAPAEVSHEKSIRHTPVRMYDTCFQDRQILTSQSAPPLPSSSAEP
jgi:hypothetical protein